MVFNFYLIRVHVIIGNRSRLGFSISLMRNLKIHRITNTDEKTFSCDQCPKSFNQRAHLKTHRRTHTGEKPFLCDQCPKSFSDSSNLKKH